MIAARAAALVAAAALAACATGRLDALEARLAEAEAARARERAAEQARLDEVDRRLSAIARRVAAGELAYGADVAAQLERILDELEDLRQRVAAAVKAAQAPAAAPSPRRRDPDPAEVYAVAIAGSPVDGPADAPVTIVRGYEYACPYCERSRATMAELRRLYPDDVRIVYRHFIVHPQTATEPALAACAAQRQGRFFDMDEILWTKAYGQRKFDRAWIEQLAVEIGLDLDRFRADVSGTCGKQVADEQAALQKVGQTATPTFFVNGRFLAGAQPLASFQKLVDEELALAKKRLEKKGEKRAKYYDTWVLKQGKKEHAAAP